MALLCVLGRWGIAMQTPSISLIVASLALLAAAACGMNLQFGRQPFRFARTGFGMSVGVALVALGAVVV
jgi:hypothetical protein